METWTCSFCSKELPLKNKFTESGHLAKCDSFKIWKDTNLTEETLIKLYIDKKLSTTEIANLFGLKGATVIYNLLKKFNIPIRSLKETALMPEVRAKAAKTNLENYGYSHNLMANSPSRLAMEDGVREKYAVDNVFQLESVKIKTRETLNRRYGVDHSYELSFGKASGSSVHKGLSKELTVLGIEHKNEYKVICDENIYFVDIFIEPDILIEVYGDYWHGNPLIYGENDIILKGSSKEITVGEKWRQDAKRIKDIYAEGFEILIFWEYELNKNLDEVIRRIKDANG